MARTKTNKKNGTKTRTTRWCNKHLEKNYIFVFFWFFFFSFFFIYNFCCLHLSSAHALGGVSGVASFITTDEQLQ